MLERYVKKFKTLDEVNTGRNHTVNAVWAIVSLLIIVGCFYTGLWKLLPLAIFVCGYKTLSALGVFDKRKKRDTDDFEDNEEAVIGEENPTRYHRYGRNLRYRSYGDDTITSTKAKEKNE